MRGANVGGYAAVLDDCHAVTRPTTADLTALAGTHGGRRLVIFEYPWSSFEPVATALPELEILKVQSAGTLQRLTGLDPLPALRVLVVSPPPSWDSGNRRIEVESYAPLASLTGLERLVLVGVRPRDLDLAPLRAMTHLKALEVSGVPEFTLEHYASLAAALPRAVGRCLQPYVAIEGIGRCKQCDGRMVLLTAAPPRARKWLCPKCNEKKLAEYVAAWDAARARAAG
jgi:hypothetical protein